MVYAHAPAKAMFPRRSRIRLSGRGFAMLTHMSDRTVITIGNFDGVHLGHRRILETARERAAASGAKVVAMTFDPHPATVLRPGTQPPRLMSLDQKIAALHDAGADRVVVMEPTESVLSLDAETFIRKLVGDYHPVAMVEGRGFRFGKGRAGDTAALTRFGETYDFETVVLDPVSVALTDQLLAPVSSSFVRWLAAQGRMLDVTRCLTQPYALTSRVVTGERRGRTIGVPTANLDVDALHEHQLPRPGVYAGTVEAVSRQKFPAAISVGIKPTFDQRKLAIEAHLIDYDGDLYGYTITLRFHRWLRDQERFPSVATLQNQLHRDIDRTRDWYNAGLLGPM